MDLFTMERGEYQGIELGNPATNYPLLYGGSDLYLPMLPHREKGRSLLSQVQGMGEAVNLKAPGVRDLKPNPSFPTYGTRYRTELIDTNHTANNAPQGNWETCKELLRAPWVQRTNAEWSRLLRETATYQRAGWQEWGQFNIAPTGFTAFRALKPHSTMKFI